jgi:ribosomal protein L7/L12
MVSDEARACPKCGQPHPAHAQPDWEQRARALAASGSRIQAIRMIREATGMGLKEATHLVDEWAGRR